VLDSQSKPYVLIKCANALGEGPHWVSSEGKLYWVDIVAGTVCSVDSEGDNFNSIDLNEPVGAVVACRGGGLLAAMESGIYRIDDTGARACIANPEHDKPGNRFNDGKCDSLGRFWVGSLATDGEQRAGKLWRVDPNGQCTMMENGLSISNGLGWSPDNRRFYLTDSGCSTIFVYDYDLTTGLISGKRTFVVSAEGDGVPDGLCVDAQGFIWSAQWDGACVIRYDPDGNIERRVPLPVPRPTSCAFGGATNQTLYITSARTGLSCETLQTAPCSGHVFGLNLTVPGMQVNMFG